jgi:hypothetical protein
VNKRAALPLAIIILLAAFLGWWFLLRDSGPPLERGAYADSFDEPGSWTVGDDATATGTIQNGVYEMYVELSGDIFWVTGGRNFADGRYQVAATPVEGVIDNGYGMLFRVDSEDSNFYVFKVSSDGYVFIGRCSDSCAQADPLVERDWFVSDAVLQGQNVTNVLSVEARGSDMIFYVNETEVGRAADETLTQGDIGLVAETFAPGGLRVHFDDFSVTPLAEN